MSTGRLIDLLPYQKRLVEDRHRFIVVKWCRQAGKSFGVAVKVVLESIEKPTTWVVLSRGERQSREIMAKVASIARGVCKAAELVSESEGIFKAYDAEYKQLEVRLPTMVDGQFSRIIGLPANPDTARGYSANVVLDEFGIHALSREIWTALFGCITRGYRLIVLSTPKGRQNKYYDIWEHGGPTWSRHATNIHEAIAEGLVLRNEDGSLATAEDLRQALGDDEAWAQEYLCEFVDEASAWLTYDLIGECESGLASMEWDSTATYASAVPPPARFVGFDVARRRDLSIIWTCDLVGDVLWTREVLRLEKTPFRIQREQLYAAIERPGVRRACIDETGIGMQIAEEAREKYGSRVEPVNFGMAGVKEGLATILKEAFEDKLVRIPIDKEIRDELHKVQKLTTAAGNHRYDAERTDNKAGHADHFWALALCVHGRKAAPHPIRFDYTQVQGRRFGQQRGCW